MKADEYILFEEQPVEKKTRIVTVRNRRSLAPLGELRWHGPWRQYCFFPQGDTIFNPGCMERIAGEALSMTHAHRISSGS